MSLTRMSRALLGVVERAVDHPCAPVVEHEERGGGAVADTSRHGPGVEPHGLGEGQRLGGRGDVHAAQQLVDQLDLLAVTGLGSPTTGALRASVSSSGRTRSTASAAPLTMINRSPSPARATPPETGASTTVYVFAHSSTAAGPT